MAVHPTMKERGINLSLNTFTSLVVLIPAIWFIGKPVLVTAVSDAMAGDIQDQIRSGVAPLNMAFMALIRKDINSIRREISAMEFRRDNPPDNDWTQDDSSLLLDLRLELEAQQEALLALMQ